MFSADHQGIQLVNENGLPDNEQIASSPAAFPSAVIELAAISIIHHYAVSPPPCPALKLTPQPIPPRPQFSFGLFNSGHHQQKRTVFFLLLLLSMPRRTSG